jgi:hypothetical protein
MKTQIIQLEPHDDAISTRDKMGWGQTSRIVLVWPKGPKSIGAPVLNRRLDLVLLQRHSTSLGAQLALVTRDRSVRFYAGELRIPVFRTLKEAQNSRWRTGRRKRLHLRRTQPRPDFAQLREEVHPRPPAWLEKPPARFGFFSLGVISFLAIIVYLLPGARIELAPKTELQETALTIEAGPHIKEVSMNGEMPASYKTVIVEGRDSLPASGKIGVPETQASGYVRFTNLTDEPVAIPKSLVIMTLGPEEERVRFATSAEGKVRGGAGESIVLAVRALSPGAQGNMPPNSLVSIEGPLGLKLSANNSVATSGGSNRALTAPSRADYKKLHDRLVETLRMTALDELKLTLEPNDFPITSTLTLTQTIEEEFIPELDGSRAASPSENLQLTLRLEYQVLVVEGSDFERIGTELLNASLPQGTAPMPGTIEIAHLSDPRIEKDGAYRWKVHIQRLVQPQVDLESAASGAAGQSIEQAAKFLGEWAPLDSPPVIQIAPSWWPRLPLLPFRIEVDVRE